MKLEKSAELRILTDRNFRNSYRGGVEIRYLMICLRKDELDPSLCGMPVNFFFKTNEIVIYRDEKSHLSLRPHANKDYYEVVIFLNAERSSEMFKCSYLYCPMGTDNVDFGAEHIIIRLDSE